jgi:hypothetical protein
MAEETAHRPPWRVDRRLAERGLAEAFRVEPGPVRTSELAVEVGDGAIIAGQVSVGEPSFGQ